MTFGLDKAWWASNMQGVRKSQRFSDRLAKAHAFSHLEAAHGGRKVDDDAVIVDSPSTTNHYHQPPPPSPWPWVAVALAVLAVALLVYLPWNRTAHVPPVPPVPPVTSVPPVTPVSPVSPAYPGTGRSYLEFYRP